MSGGRITSCLLYIFSNYPQKHPKKFWNREKYIAVSKTIGRCLVQRKTYFRKKELVKKNVLSFYQASASVNINDKKAK